MLKLLKSDQAAVSSERAKLSSLHQRTSSIGSAPTIYIKGEHASYQGPGGWGALIVGNDKTVKLFGGHPGTSENQMALMSAIAALESLCHPSHVLLCTDNEYLKNGAGWWIIHWKRNGWKTKTGNLVRHRDLWKRLDRAQRRHEITWSLITADNSDKPYRRAALLARKGLALALQKSREVGPIIAKPKNRKN